MSDAINILGNDIAGLVDKVLEIDTTSKSNDKPKQQTPSKRPHLPVLIIPGFMSSGLEVKQSSIKPKWENERLWLNLKSLGLSKFISNNTKGKVVQQNYQKSLERRKSMMNINDQDSDDDEENQQSQKEEVASTNIWIKHISLQSDLISDPDGIRVRPMSGLKGVDYLLPGALTNFMSYVFGPVINALKKVGYTDEKNLDAAPYDWRLPPSELEKRDEYFTKTMEKVMELYNNNGGTKVVLLCHSLGCLCGEYLLRFANTKDEFWTEKYIHTYMPIGAPHLGAPFSLRGLVSGDCMGLDTFLNDSEALAMSRSLGSIPWMIPSSIPSSTPAAAFVRREGAFEVTIHSTIDVSKLLDDRPEDSLPEKLELKLRYGKRKITSRLVRITDGKVTFQGVFVFATPEEGPSSKQCCFRCCQCCILKCAKCACCSDNHLIVSINEPGVRAARATKRKQERKKKYCGCFKRQWCKFWLIPLFLLELCIKIAGFFLYLFAYKLWVVAVDCISRSSGGSSQLAVSAPIDLREFVDLPDSTDVEVILQNDTKKCRYCRNKAKTRQVKTSLNIRWIAPNVPVNEESNKCQVAELCQKGHSQHITLQYGKKGNRELEYETASGYGMLKKASLGTTINCITGNYDTDKLTPRWSSRSVHPPVKNIKAIYGINLPTEVGAIYKRKKIIAERKDKVKARFELDENAKLPDDSLWLNDDGILFETKDTPQTVVDGGIVTCSGDGTVPYWSLQHVNSWKDKCNVEVVELEGARHREILADERFHKLLIDHVTVDNNSTTDDKV